MKYHVFNKRPSRSAVATAAQYQDPAQQADELALATFPAKGELWQHMYTGWKIVINSEHIPIEGASSGGVAVDEYGVFVANVFDGKAGYSTLLPLRKLLDYKKIGRWGKASD